jgi:hypothetical protein
VALTTKIVTQVIASLTDPLDLSTPVDALDYTSRLSWSSGTGVNAADMLWHDRRTLSASATENLDLAGGLTNAFGDAQTFARVRLLYVAASSANTNNVLVGGDATSTFLTWVVAENDAVVVRPGGFMMLAAPDATAYAVTATTGDLLTITNSAGSTSVTYDIVIIGASA